MTPIEADRIVAAIYDTDVSRAVVLHDWPECHKKGCQGSHPDPNLAMSMMAGRFAQQVRNEIDYRSTTRPDVSGTDTDGNPRLLAVYTLATLLNRYNVHDASTFVRAASLMIDAYPGLVEPLTAALPGTDKENP